MKYILSFIFISVTVVFGLSRPQQDVVKVKTRYGFEVNRKPTVNFNVFVNYSDSSWNPQINLAVTIQNDILQFEKKENAYIARYRTSVAIRYEDTAVHSETWTSDVTLSDFEETNSRSKYQYKRYQLSGIYPSGEKKLKPGSYECFMEIRDLVTKKALSRKRKFTIVDPAETDKRSEVTFLLNQPDSSAMLPLTPSDSVLNFSQKYTCFARIGADSSVGESFNTRIYKLEREQADLVFQDFSNIRPNGHSLTLLVEIPSDSLTEGKYRIRLTAGDINLEKEFSIVWFEKPTYLYKAGLALRPMKYILDEDLYKEAKSKKNDELQNWLRKYWDRKDPTPGTAFNELLDVFFKRVQQANKDYSSRYREGWETDRGKIYIMYGEPEKIDNRRYATKTFPHLVWIYGDGQTFVFSDPDRDGEFSLVEEQDKE